MVVMSRFSREAAVVGKEGRGEVKWEWVCGRDEGWMTRGTDKIEGGRESCSSSVGLEGSDGGWVMLVHRRSSTVQRGQWKYVDVSKSPREDSKPWSSASTSAPATLLFQGFVAVPGVAWKPPNINQQSPSH